MVGTSDAHFNDGYFIALYAQDWYFFAGLRLHPNGNVIDGWASVAHDGRQIAVRASRALRPHYDELAVGPVRLTIVEPMARRCTSRSRTTPRASSSTWTWSREAPPFIEDRDQHVKYGAVINDTIRYTTVCRATGHGRAMGIELAIDGWHAMRDHSWGVRSSMGVPTRVSGTNRPLRSPATGRCSYRCHSRQATTPASSTPTRRQRASDRLRGPPRLAGRRSIGLTGMTHDLTYAPGTQRPTGSSLVLEGADGVARKYGLRAAGSPADVQAAAAPRLARRAGSGIYPRPGCWKWTTTTPPRVPSRPDRRTCRCATAWVPPSSPCTWSARTAGRAWRTSSTASAASTARTDWAEDMDLADLRRLVDAFEASDWNEIHLTVDGVEVHLSAAPGGLPPAPPATGASSRRGLQPPRPRPPLPPRPQLPLLRAPPAASAITESPTPGVAAGVVGAPFAAPGSAIGAVPRPRPVRRVSRCRPSPGVLLGARPPRVSRPSLRSVPGSSPTPWCASSS